MIKFLIGFAAAPGLSRAQSLLHYRERHAPLVSGIPSFWRHVRGYVQNFAVDADVDPAGPAALDGVSELWFDDWDGYERAFAEPLYLEHIRPDEQRFADFASLVVVFADDAKIFGGDAAPAFKLLRFVTRAAGLTADEFARRWEAELAPATAADPVVRRFASGYVQNRPLRTGDVAFQPSPSIDGVEEYWFADAADLAGFLSAEAEGPTGRSNGLSASVVQIATRTRVVGGAVEAERSPPVQREERPA